MHWKLTLKITSREDELKSNKIDNGKQDSKRKQMTTSYGHTAATTEIQNTRTKEHKTTQEQECRRSCWAAARSFEAGLQRVLHQREELRVPLQTNQQPGRSDAEQTQAEQKTQAMRILQKGQIPLRRDNKDPASETVNEFETNAITAINYPIAEQTTTHHRATNNTISKHDNKRKSVHRKARRRPAARCCLRTERESACVRIWAAWPS